MSESLVLITTAADDVPVIIERPDAYPFSPGERELYREATDEEYSRYYEWYLGYNDALEGMEPDPKHGDQPMYKKGFEQMLRDKGGQ